MILNFKKLLFPKPKTNACRFLTGTRIQQKIKLLEVK